MRCQQQSAKCVLVMGAELPDDIVKNMKMLKRMQVLEEKGSAFATRPLSSLPVIGAPSIGTRLVFVIHLVILLWLSVS